MKNLVLISTVLVAMAGAATAQSASEQGANTPATGKVAGKADTPANPTAFRRGNPNGNGRDLTKLQPGAAQSAPEG